MHLSPCPSVHRRKRERHALRSCCAWPVGHQLDARLLFACGAALFLALTIAGRAFAVPMSWGGGAGGGSGCSGTATLSNGIATVSNECVTASATITLRATGDPNQLY